jgi:hypothetical protein
VEKGALEAKTLYTGKSGITFGPAPFKLMYEIEIDKNRICTTCKHSEPLYDVSETTHICFADVRPEDEKEFNKILERSVLVDVNEHEGCAKYEKI